MIDIVKGAAGSNEARRLMPLPVGRDFGISPSSERVSSWTLRLDC